MLQKKNGAGVFRLYEWLRSLWKEFYFLYVLAYRYLSALSSSLGTSLVLLLTVLRLIWRWVERMEKLLPKNTSSLSS